MGRKRLRRLQVGDKRTLSGAAYNAKHKGVVMVFHRAGTLDDTLSHVPTVDRVRVHPGLSGQREISYPESVVKLGMNVK